MNQTYINKDIYNNYNNLFKNLLIYVESIFNRIIVSTFWKTFKIDKYEIIIILPLYILLILLSIIVIQNIYIYYIFKEIKKTILKKDEKKYELKYDSCKKQCYGLNEKSIIRKNPKRNNAKSSDSFIHKNDSKQLFDEYYKEQKQFITDNYPQLNENEIYNYAKKCYRNGYAYILEDKT